MGKKLVFLLSALLLPLVMFAQSEITGSVKEAGTQEPLIGVSIAVKGGNAMAVTDFDGNFKIKASSNDVLVFSYIGYKTQEVALNNRSQITVEMSEDSSILDEVVVVGYGTQKKVNVTGAVTQVKMDDVAKDRPVTSIAEALMGNTPGLTLTGNSGEPGSGYNFNVRGTSSINGSSPLILVDGISMDVSSLNPNDIESVSVLKDASAAAVYGARAAFGVILITTKKSAKEMKPQISMSAKLSWQSPQSMAKRATPLETVNALLAHQMTVDKGGQQYTTWRDLLTEYTANPSKYPDGYAVVDDVRYDLAMSDVTDDMMETGFQQIYDVAVTGGSKKSKYRISGSYLDSNGVLVTKNDGYRRYNISSFLNTEITDWLSAELTVLFTNSNKKDPYTVKFNSRDVWAQATSMASWAPLGGTTINGEEYQYLTPRHMLERGIPQETKYNRLNAVGRLIATPVKGLSITGEYSINKTFYDQKTYNKRIDNFVDYRTQSILPPNEASSVYTKRSAHTDYNALNLFATYDFSTTVHKFTVMGGMNYEEYDNESMNASRAGLISEKLYALSLATEVPTVSDSYTKNSVFGVFYRFNYSILDRYLLEATGRYDGSSKFPKGHRFGFFPSFSAGWRISEEPFMKGFKALDNLKLRASWGSIGNQNIGDFLYLPSLSTGTAKWVTIDNIRPMTMETPALVRSNFTWETVTTTNIGLDWGFFNNRLNGSFDYFIRKTTNMLGPGPDFPATLGAASPMQNAADMRTNGWEFAINWMDKIGDWSYRVGVNVSDAKSKILHYNNPTKTLTMSYYEGMQLGEIWGYETDRLYTASDFVEGSLQTTAQGELSGGTLKEGVPHFEGVNPNPGDVLYKNADANGMIWKGENTADNPGSRRIIGNSTPRYTFGISLGVGWKGLDLSILLQGVGKRDLWTRNVFTQPFSGDSGSNETSLYTNLLDYWTPENQNANFYRLYADYNPNVGANNQIQTRYLFNAAYLDVKSVVLTYTLPKKVVGAIGLANVSVFLNGENLFSFNHMPKGVHPDGQSRGYAENVSSGGFAYPMMRKFTLGLNVAF